jgi:hypothetical protein
MDLLVDMRKEIETKGLDEDRDYSILQAIYGDPLRPHLERTLYSKYWGWSRIAKVHESVRQKMGYATPEQCKQSVLRCIDGEINHLKEFQVEFEPIESERTRLEILSRSVPDSHALDRLLRYESSLERAYDRTLTQLERAQRMRKGQPLPPQLDVKIS